MGANIECPECGFMHPPVARGNCPMAKAEGERKEAIAEYGSTAFEIATEIQKAFLKKIQIYNNPEKHKELATSVLSFINALK